MQPESVLNKFIVKYGELVTPMLFSQISRFVLVITEKYPYLGLIFNKQFKNKINY